MKKALLSIALTAGFAGSALAADLPMKAQPMAPVAMAYNWTGCYVGVGAGYGMWNQEHRTLDPAGVPVTTGTATAGGRGWFGTAQVGCDYQFAPRWVIGAFGDFDFGSLKGNLEPTVGTIVGEEKLKSSWAAGARIGYVVFPQLLAYVSGGYTQARFDGVTFVSLFGLGPSGIVMDPQTYRGWFLGTGYEYGLDFLPGLFWKTEYRYARYRAESPGFFDTTRARTLIGFERSEKDIQTIRSELVYRFNWGGGPVVARY